MSFYKDSIHLKAILIFKLCATKARRGCEGKARHIKLCTS